MQKWKNKPHSPQRGQIKHWSLDSALLFTIVFLKLLVWDTLFYPVNSY